ncbi:hypothetical protein [Kitasatospora sp. NPDC050543]|uniref:hypothetical protein n=1 Tax=Kitasatospora sp. NPDC050543 TaxID=3364054 RepID=UPI0037BA8DA7
MPIKPPESQDEPSGFDPGQASPPIRFGVFGDSQVGPGLLGSSGKAAGGVDGGIESGAGVLGVNTAVEGVGVHGSCRAGTGVSGRGGGEGPGVAGVAEAGPGVSGWSGTGPGVTGSSAAIGVYGESRNDDTTGIVHMEPSRSIGVMAVGEVGLRAVGAALAAEFEGDVHVSGSVTLVDSAGLVTGLSAGPRRAVGVPAGHQELRAPRAAADPALSVQHSPAAELRARSDGGLDLNLLFPDRPTLPALSVIGPAGRVGIGTAAPAAALEINCGATDDLALHLVSSGAGWGSGLQLSNTASRQTFGMYAGSDGTWHFTASGTDLLTIRDEQGGVDVRRRMRVRQGADLSAGIWFHSTNDRAFVGLVDDTHVGFYGTGGVGWGLMMDTRNGDVTVKGRLIQLGGGSRIDHPLEPATKYLSHSFVESPRMTNIYDGTVVTDDRGEATVVLPGYFEALNGDFRYQLTPVGSLALAAVTEEIRENRFTIRTDRPAVTVCWQVTGVRHDPWADANRISGEEDKPEAEQHRYPYPQGHGQPVGGIVP